MLSKQEMVKIARNECIAMLGAELVQKHKDKCCASYGFSSNGLFSFNLGMDTKERAFEMGDETPMEYYAHVIVAPTSGKVTRDYDNSILPQ